MSQRSPSKLLTVTTGIVAGILVLIPFHAFLSVWAGSSHHIYDTTRIWKEVLLLILSGMTIVIIWRDKLIRERLRHWPLAWLIGCFVGLHAIVGLGALVAGRVTVKALAYGLIVNLRFVVFFVICTVIASRSEWLKEHWQRLLFIPASVVVGFGLLQAFLLPNDFLTHFGYGHDTIQAYQLVDQKPDFPRVQSTLRGPNPLGAYLVVIIAGAVGVLGARKAGGQRWSLGILLAASVIVLIHSYSRSAYLGALVAIVAVGWLMIHSRQVRRWLLIGGASLMVIVAGATYLLRGNDLVQNTLFHTDEHSVSSHSSNQERAYALRAGLGDLRKEPLGRGPGTAGPASVYNGSVRIAEDYYIQIGQEVGWIGLGLFVSILAMVGRQLFKQRTDVMAVVMFGSLIAISIINLVSHAWADDTLSLLWWGLAGVILGSRGEVHKGGI